MKSDTLHIPVITSFDGDYRFLSNFWPCDIPFEGEVYASVEHAYQAAKTTDLHARAQIRVCDTAGQAKRYGQHLTLRPNWAFIKVSVMRSLCNRKFALPPLQDRLIETYPQQLIEGNTWGDQFWGVCNGRGQNHLGKILMHIRLKLVRRSRKA